MSGVMKKAVLFFLSICLVKRLDAEISISVTTDSDYVGDGRVKCNSKAVVTCSMSHYAIMAWTIDGNVVAECTYEKCYTYDTNYDFSFNTSSGTFNITMNSVIFTDNRKIFKCDDGTNSSSLLAKVYVIPDSSLTSISTSKDKHSTDIRVTTGCLYPSSDIKFKWYYFNADKTPELYTFNSSIKSTTEDGCTNGPCGGKGVVKITNTLTIKEDPNGDDFYFQVLIKYRDTTIVIVKADQPFKLNGNQKQAVGNVIGNGTTPIISFAALVLCVIIHRILTKNL